MDHKAWEHRNINDFFEAYAQAMLQQDTRLMTRFYELPCTLIGDGIASAFSEPNKLEGMFNQGIVYYTQLGVRQFRPEVRSRQAMNEQYSRVKVLWHHCTENGAELYACYYEYILHLDKTGFWKMQVVLSVDERERLADWQQQQENTAASA